MHGKTHLLTLSLDSGYLGNKTYMHGSKHSYPPASLVLPYFLRYKRSESLVKEIWLFILLKKKRDSKREKLIRYYSRCNENLRAWLWRETHHRLSAVLSNHLRTLTACFNILIMLIYSYIITKLMRALWMVNQLWFIVPVNSWKNRASSELFLNAARDLRILLVFYQHSA